MAVGCTTARHLEVDTPVGPSPLTAPGRGTQGGLVVFTDLMPNGNDIERQRRSKYDIFLPDGLHLKEIENRTGDRFESPVVVNLAPGRYRVVAGFVPIGTVGVAVVIEAGKTTFVYLDGTRHPERKKGNASDFVRLPDGGMIIGWRAKDSPQ